MFKVPRWQGRKVQVGGLYGMIACVAILLAAASCDESRSDSESLQSAQVQFDQPTSAPAPSPPIGATGFGSAGGERAGRVGAAMAPPPAPGIESPQSDAQMPSAMLIKTGEVAVEVDSVEAGVTEVEGLAARAGGYVSSISVQAGERQHRTARVEIRVPSQRFDEVVSGLGPLGKVLSVSVHSQDVGEEFVDVTARLANARRLEERLLALLANRTGKLEDVLAVERELARVRGEIERYEGRLRYLRNRADMSALAVILQQPRPLLARQPGVNPIRDAFGTAWRNFVGFIALLIEAMGVLVPLAVLAVLALLAVRRWWWRKPPPTAGEPA